MRNLFKRYKKRETASSIAEDARPRGIHHTVKVEGSYNDTWNHIWAEIKNIGIAADAERNFKSEEIYSYKCDQSTRNSIEKAENKEAEKMTHACQPTQVLKVYPQLSSTHVDEIKNSGHEACKGVEEKGDTFEFQSSYATSHPAFIKTTVDFAIAASQQNFSPQHTYTVDQLVFTSQSSFTAAFESGHLGATAHHNGIPAGEVERNKTENAKRKQKTRPAHHDLSQNHPLNSLPQFFATDSSTYSVRRKSLANEQYTRSDTDCVYKNIKNLIRQKNQSRMDAEKNYPAIFDIRNYPDIPRIKA